MKKKELKEYIEKYGGIPKNFFERFLYLIKLLNLQDKEIIKLQKYIRKLLKAKWEEINFVFYMIPKATPRPRAGKYGIFYVKDANSNNKLFKEFVDSYEGNLPLITTPCKLLVDVYLPIPDQMSKVEKVLSELKLIRPIVKPDWDNVGKTYSDMIQKHLLLEDCLVIDGRTRKFYSLKPRIEISIKYMTKYDCKFNKRKVEKWKQYEEIKESIEEKDSIV